MSNSNVSRLLAVSLGLGQIFLLGFLGSCIDDDGTGATLLSAHSFNPDSCVVDEQFIISSGTLDPTGGSTFSLAISAQNNSDVEDNSDSGSGGTFSPENDTLSLVGFETCWARVEDLEERDNSSGTLMDCSTLQPSQQRFIAESGSLPPLPDQQIFAAHILSTEDLRGIYGSAFSPAGIPERGLVSSTDNGVQYRFSAESAEQINCAFPGDTGCRDPDWGNFPSDRGQSDEVIVQLRANFKRPNGSVVLSNWFIFSVDICVGCFTGNCTLSLNDCGKCAVGSCDADYFECASNGGGDCVSVCPVGGADCDLGWIGTTTTGSGSCLPYQGLGQICAPIDDCN